MHICIIYNSFEFIYCMPMIQSGKNYDVQLSERLARLSISWVPDYRGPLKPLICHSSMVSRSLRGASIGPLFCRVENFQFRCHLVNLGENPPILQNEKYFLNLVHPHQIWILITLFRLIWHQMEFRLIP